MTAMVALSCRPWARNPDAPNRIANDMASAKCQAMLAGDGSGASPLPGPDATRCDVTGSTAQAMMTCAASAAAIGTAPAAAALRQAIATVAAVSAANAMVAAESWSCATTTTQAAAR